MTLLHAAVLGMIQGLTEFLPISSSGHLVILQNLLGLQEATMHFDIMVHVATMLAIVWMFRRQIDVLLLDGWKECVQVLKRKGNPFWQPRGALRYLSCLLLATFITGVIGLTFEDWFESMFANPRGVGVALILTGGVLLLTLRAPKNAFVVSTDQMLWWHAALIGVAQGLAVTPGLSRSGLTIAVALLLGLNRSLAVQFSFILSIPAIMGVAVREILTCSNPTPTGVLLTGMFSAFVVSYLCLYLITFIVKRGRLHWFAFYCIPLGLVVLLFLS